ncbi:hypothetical protein OH76DRAFT_1334884 [Lentinus brumalis]|uniref:Uncharacterized protein n=1 Tax=Lentinus brumalis TaxID=2498619 RepID=A0A371DX14_9APHY|nr:hypothetical protein OH76DRAFT_1334884 [Polyporus brumalis]
MSERVLALHHLPVELLYEIHLFALSPALPLTCKHLHAVLKFAPTTIHAEYLIRSHQAAIAQSAEARARGLVSYALRFPICSRNVLEAIFRSPECPSAPPHQATVLPRRLFRHLAPRDEPGQPHWTDDDEPLPFLRFLYDHPRVPRIFIDSYDGYALTRAVYAGFTPLIRFLLSKGASPECKGSLPVTVAIRRKSLPLVRMLIERDYHDSAVADGPRPKKRRRLGGGAALGIESKGGRDTSSGGSASPLSGSGKRRKLGDRVAVNSDMLKMAVKCDARDIVEYFMKEKGCVPDMQTVLMMS